MSDPKPSTIKAEHAPPPPLPPSSPPPDHQAHIPFWVWLIAACGIVGVILLVLLRAPAEKQPTGRGKGAAGQGPVRISAAVVHKGDVGIYLDALGIVTPVKTVMVKSRVDGELIAVNYQEGQLVKAGDSLVEIDPQPYQAQLITARGALDRDKALLENAYVDLERYKIALSSNAIPKQQYDTQVATVHQYQGTVLNDQGQVSNALVQVAYCHITAPISGRVGLRLVDTGNIVKATDPNALAVITQMQPMTMIFGVNEDFLPEFQAPLLAGERLEVEALDAHKERKLETGKVIALDSQVDTNTATVRLRAEFPNQNLVLFPNQPANARLLARTLHDALLLPTRAVQEGNQGMFVYVVQTSVTNSNSGTVTNQTVAMRPVSLVITNPSLLLRPPTKAAESDEGITAVEGVQAGEVVATDGFNRLQDGTTVTVRGPAAPGGGRPKGGATNSTNVARRKPKQGPEAESN